MVPVEEESDKFLNLSLLTLNSHCRRFWRFELNCFRFWVIWVCVGWRWGARRMIRWWPWSWWVVPLKVNAICLFVLFHLQQIMGCFFFCFNWWLIDSSIGAIGTRFRPLSLNIPKPLFPLGGQPMVHHPISACKRVCIFLDPSFTNCYFQIWGVLDNWYLLVLL